MKVSQIQTSKLASRRRGTGNAASAADAFSGLLGTDSSAAAPAMGGIVSAANVSGILALQGVEDQPPESRGGSAARERAEIAAGNRLLDELDSLRQDLLLGRVNVAKLQRISTMRTTADRASDPKLTEIMQEIKLRAAVELAKLSVAGLA